MAKEKRTGKKTRRRRAKLTRAEIDGIVKWKGQGKTNRQICAEFKVGVSTVSRVIKEHAPHLAGASPGWQTANLPPPASADFPWPPSTEPGACIESRGPVGTQGAGGREEPVEADRQEAQYLRWVAKGAIRGWVDRLLKEIERGELD